MPTGTLTRNTSRQFTDGQQTAQDQPDQGTADEGYLVQSQGHASFSGRKGVGQDSHAVGKQEAAPTAWIRRKMINSMAPVLPVPGVRKSRMEPTRKNGKAERYRGEPGRRCRTAARRKPAGWP